MGDDATQEEEGTEPGCMGREGTVSRFSHSIEGAQGEQKPADSLSASGLDLIQNRLQEIFYTSW